MNPAAGHDGLQVVTPSTEKIYHAPTKAEKQVIHEKGDDASLTYANDPARPSPRARKILGFKRCTFWIVAVVLLVIVIAAAVGGGVGSSKAGRSTEAASGSASSTTSPTASARTSGSSTTIVSASSNSVSTRTSASASSTSTSTTTPTFGTYNCPSENGTLYTSSTRRYQILCDADFPVGTTGVNGTAIVQDLNTGIVATSIQACVDLCAANRLCGAVTYTPNITAAVERDGITGNCFLKNSRSAIVFYRTDDIEAVSAYVVA